MHVVQRGVDRQDCFRSPADYGSYLAALRESAEKYGVAIHSYVLMTNHVHLLGTPVAADSMSRMMQQLGRQYVRYFNWKHERSGPLWEGRFRSSVIQSERYLLACYRYIELNPVRAGMVRKPCEYRWSSFRANALGHHDANVSPHTTWIALGNDDSSRRDAYNRLFEQADDQASDALIRNAWLRNAQLA